MRGPAGAQHTQAGIYEGSEAAPRELPGRELFLIPTKESRAPLVLRLQEQRPHHHRIQSPAPHPFSAWISYPHLSSFPPHLSLHPAPPPLFYASFPLLLPSAPRLASCSPS